MNLHQGKAEPTGLRIELIQTLYSFLNRGISTSPQAQALRLTAPTILLLCILNGFIGAVLTGVTYQSWLRFFVALLILPTGAMLATWITTWFLKLTHKWFHQVHLPFRGLASTLSIAHYPWWSTTGLIDKLPFVTVLGFLFSMWITRQWLIRDFSAPKAIATRWVLVMALTHAALWGGGFLGFS